LNFCFILLLLIAVELHSILEFTPEIVFGFCFYCTNRPLLKIILPLNGVLLRDVKGQSG
jgi:hypothetical protein